jgi:RepB DNA-primase from phage plasmid
VPNPRTIRAVRGMLAALDAPAYELGILQGDKMRVQNVTASAVMGKLDWLASENVKEAHIYIRPFDEHNLTLIDDLNKGAVLSLASEGYHPCAVVETSPGNYQAWVKHCQVLPKRLSTFAAKVLAGRFGGDPSSADWRHFGRLPGFTNRKPKYRQSNGRYPFVLLHTAKPNPFPMAQHFYLEIASQYELMEQERESARQARQNLSHAERMRLTRKPLSYFRELPKYDRQPAQADMAFAVFHLAAGFSEGEIAADLEADYLSSDPNTVRREAYIQRTLDKARLYVHEWQHVYT